MLFARLHGCVCGVFVVRGELGDERDCWQSLLVEAREEIAFVLYVLRVLARADGVLLEVGGTGCWPSKALPASASSQP